MAAGGFFVATGILAPAGLFAGADCYTLKECLARSRGAGAPKQALEYLGEALRLCPREDSRTRASIHVNRGALYSRLGQQRKAIAELDKAAGLNPGFSAAYHNRGNAYFALGENERALADYNTAIKLKPENPDAYIARGNVYAALRSYAKALAGMNQAIARAPALPSAYAGRAYVYGLLGRHNEAASDLSKAIEIDTELVPESYIARGYEYLWLNKCAQAKADLEKGISLGAQPAAAYANMGVYEWACGRSKANALLYYEKAFKSGFTAWSALYDEESDGHFIKGLNASPEFKALLRKYRKQASEPGQDLPGVEVNVTHTGN
jgi:tetratricopeptide (TPR) repeat protein